MALVTKKELVGVLQDAIKYDVFFDGRYDLDKDGDSKGKKSLEEHAQDIFEGNVAFDFSLVQSHIQTAKREYGKEFVGAYAKKDFENKTVSVLTVKNEDNGNLFSSAQGYNGIVVTYVDARTGEEVKFPYDGNELRFSNLLQDEYDKTELYTEMGIHPMHDIEWFTHDEAVRIVMDGIATGVIKVHYIAGNGYDFIIEDKRINLGVNPFEFPEKLIQTIYNGRYGDISFEQLQNAAQEWLDTGIPDEYTLYEDTKEYKNHRFYAGLLEVDKAYGVNGILDGMADTSTNRPIRDMEWVRVYAALRGFGLDYVVEHEAFPFRNEVLNYYRDARGLDLRDPEVLKQWCQEHKGLCYNKELVKEYKEEKKTKVEYALFRDSFNKGNEVYSAIEDFVNHHTHAIGMKEYESELKVFLQEKGLQVYQVVEADDKGYYFDFNYGPITGSIHVYDDRDCHVVDGFEVWNDNTNEFLGNYDLKDIQAKVQELESQLKELEGVSKEENEIEKYFPNLETEYQINDFANNQIQMVWFNPDGGEGQGSLRVDTYSYESLSKRNENEPLYCNDWYELYYDLYSHDAVADLTKIDNILGERAIQVSSNITVKELKDNFNQEKNKVFVKYEDVIELNGEQYGVSLSFKDNGEDCLKWHNYDFTKLDNPKEGYLLQIVQESMQDEPRFSLEKFEKDEAGNLEGEWVEVEDVIKNEDEVRQVETLLVQLSDQDVLKNYRGSYFDISFLNDGCIVEKFIQYGYNKTYIKELYKERNFSDGQIDTALAYLSEKYDLEHKEPVWISSEMYLGEKLDLLSEKEGTWTSSIYEFKQVFDDQDKFRIQFLQKENGEQKFYAQMYAADEKAFVNQEGILFGWGNIEKEFGDSYDVAAVKDFVTAMEGIELTKQKDIEHDDR